MYVIKIGAFHCVVYLTVIYNNLFTYVMLHSWSVIDNSPSDVGALLYHVHSRFHVCLVGRDKGIHFQDMAHR
jgi:hypothetical protein